MEQAWYRGPASWSTVTPEASASRRVKGWLECVKAMGFTLPGRGGLMG